MLTNDQAAVIAAQWHSGQGSALYSLTSMGYTARGQAAAALDEVRGELETLARDLTVPGNVIALADLAQLAAWLVPAALADDDGSELEARLAAGGPDANLVLDGSMYSPSWRALDGGADLWGDVVPALDQGADADAGEAYEAQLLAWTEHLGLEWADGCLWLDPPSDEPEDRPQACGCPADYHLADCPRRS